MQKAVRLNYSFNYWSAPFATHIESVVSMLSGQGKWTFPPLPISPSSTVW